MIKYDPDKTLTAVQRGVGDDGTLVQTVRSGDAGGAAKPREDSALPWFSHFSKQSTNPNGDIRVDTDIYDWIYMYR